MSVKELVDKRVTLAKQASEIPAKAKAEGRAITGEEKAKWEKCLDEVDALKVQIDDKVKTNELENRQANTERELNEVRATSIGRASTIVDLGKSRDLKAEAFRSYIRCGGIADMPHDLRQVALQEFRTTNTGMAEGTTTTGGYLVPQGFRAIIVDALKSYVGVRQAPVEVITTESGNPMPQPTGDDTSNTGALLAEQTQAASNILPTIGQVLFQAYMFSSNILPISIQLIQDSGIDIEAYIAKKLGQRIGRAQAAYFTTGTGTGQPQGIVTGASQAQVNSSNYTIPTSQGALTWINLMNLAHSVDPAYREDQTKCGYMFNDAVFRDLKLQVDGLGRPLWQPSVIAGEPDRINGYRVYINQQMSGCGTDTNVPAIFGDFSYYTIRDVVGGMSLIVLKERYMDYLQYAYLTFLRSDGKVTNSSAIKYLAVAS